MIFLKYHFLCVCVLNGREFAMCRCMFTHVCFLVISIFIPVSVLPCSFVVLSGVERLAVRVSVCVQWKGSGGGSG